MLPVRIDPGFRFLVLVILLWAWNPLLVSHLSLSLPILEVDFLATAFALASIGAIVTARRGWGTLRALAWRERRNMALIGAIGIFPYTALYYLAFAISPADPGSVNIVNYLWPILTVVFSSFLLKERLSPLKVAAVVTSFCGVIVLISWGRTSNPHSIHLLAYLVAGCGAAFWALFSVLTKRHHQDPFVSMFLYTAGALPLFGLLWLVSSQFRMPTLLDWCLLFALGFGLNGIGYSSWIRALQVGKTAQMASGVYLVPFVALVYLSIFHRSAIHLVQVLSLALILLGPVALQFLAPSKHESPEIGSTDR